MSDPGRLWNCTQAWQGHDVAGASEGLYAYLERFPEDPEANDGLAQLLRYYDRKPIVAEEFARRAVAARPADPAKRLTLARTLSDQQLYADAVKVLAEGLASPVARPEADYFWELARAGTSAASVSTEAGAPAAVRRWLECAVSLDPDHPAAWPALHRLLVAAEDYPAALEVWRNAHKYAMTLGFVDCITAGVDYGRLIGPVPKGQDRHLLFARLFTRLCLFPEACDEYRKAGDGLRREDAIARDALASFLRFKDKLNVLLDDYNRAQLGQGKRGDDPRIGALIRQQLESDPAVFEGMAGVRLTDETEALAFILGKYGMAVRVAAGGGGFLDVQYGYITGSRTEQVELWGERSELRCFLVERMEQNGFEWWYAGKKGGIAGWCDDGERFTLVGETLGVLAETARTLRDPEGRASWLNATSYDALSSQGVHDVTASPRLVRDLTLRGLGMTETGDPAGVGMRAKDDTLVAHVYRSGVVHEAQHALDDRLVHRHQDGAELEYRAKLANIAFVDNPHLSLLDMVALDRTTMPGEPHLEANVAALTDFCAIVAAHPVLYPSVDTSRNILRQLSLLSEEQIQDLARRAFRQRFTAGAYR